MNDMNKSNTQETTRNIALKLQSSSWKQNLILHTPCDHVLSTNIMQVWTIHISPGIWYNITMRTIPILVILALLLSSCGNGRETVEERTGDTSGAKSAVLSMPSITSLKIAARPTAPLGVFASMFLAQGVFTPSASALKGIDAEMLIIRGQEGKET